MKISVVIPVYNVERYLVRCLDSVLAAATYLSQKVGGACAEIICVDDGSTDGSSALLARYSDIVKIVTKANGGLGSARNAGLDVATGDYVTFVDSDDLIPIGALATFAWVAKASGAALVISRRFGRGDGRTIPDDFATGGQSASWRLRRRSWIAGEKVQYSACNKLYRADLLSGRRFPSGMFEDFSWTTGVFCDIDTFAVVEDPQYVYCRNADAPSIVRSAYTDAKNVDSMAAIRRVLDYASGRSCASFALCQAADGLLSTIGQVCKAGDPVMARAFLRRLEELIVAYPALEKRLTPKARYRLWRVRRTASDLV